MGRKVRGGMAHGRDQVAGAARARGPVAAQRGEAAQLGVGLRGLVDEVAGRDGPAAGAAPRHDTLVVAGGEGARRATGDSPSWTGSRARRGARAARRRSARARTSWRPPGCWT